MKGGSMLGNASNFSILMCTATSLILLLITFAEGKRISDLESKVDELMERENKNNG